MACCGLVACPLLVLLQALVVTDRERLTAVCHALADAVRQADIEAFGRHVSPLFESHPVAGGTSWDKAALLEHLESTITTYRIEEPRLRGFEFELDATGAVVRFSATCRIVTADRIGSGYPSNWELTFERRGDRWQVISIRPRPSRLFPYRRLSDLPR